MIGLERAGFRGYRAKAISAVSKQSSGKYLRGCIKVREIIGSKASINLTNKSNRALLSEEGSELGSGHE